MRLTCNYGWITRSLVFIALGVILGLCFGACAVKPPAQKPASATAEEPYRFETEGKIPPLEESDIVKEMDFEEEGIVEEEVFEEDVKAPPMEARPGAASALEMTEGFRVQIFATANDETAEAVRETAERKLGLPAYVEAIEELYKVRVGDCASREEAEVLLSTCRSAGYGDAWIVETRVYKASRTQ